MLRLFRRRRRRDELTDFEAEIAREHLPIPGASVPVKRDSLATVLRHKTAVIVAAALFSGISMLTGGVYAGMWWEDRQEDARVSAEFSRTDAEFWAVFYAYNAAYEAEMRDRGFSQAEIDRAQWSAVAEVMSGEDYQGEELPEPAQADTLEIRRQLSEIEGRWDALFGEIRADL